MDFSIGDITDVEDLNVTPCPSYFAKAHLITSTPNVHEDDAAPSSKKRKISPAPTSDVNDSSDTDGYDSYDEEPPKIIIKNNFEETCDELKLTNTLIHETLSLIKNHDETIRVEENDESLVAQEHRTILENELSELYNKKNILESTIKEQAADYIECPDQVLNKDFLNDTILSATNLTFKANDKKSETSSIIKLSCSSDLSIFGSANNTVISIGSTTKENILNDSIKISTDEQTVEQVLVAQEHRTILENELSELYNKKNILESTIKEQAADYIEFPDQVLNKDFLNDTILSATNLTFKAHDKKSETSSSDLSIFGSENNTVISIGSKTKENILDDSIKISTDEQTVIESQTNTGDDIQKESLDSQVNLTPVDTILDTKVVIEATDNITQTKPSNIESKSYDCIVATATPEKHVSESKTNIPINDTLIVLSETYDIQKSIDTAINCNLECVSESQVNLKPLKCITKDVSKLSEDSAKNRLETCKLLFGETQLQFNSILLRNLNSIKLTFMSYINKYTLQNNNNENCAVKCKIDLISLSNLCDKITSLNKKHYILQNVKDLVSNLLSNSGVLVNNVRHNFTQFTQDLSEADANIIMKDSEFLYYILHAICNKDLIKKIRIPYISLDSVENEDNYNPKWDALKLLKTDAERYKIVRERWLNLKVPDPHANLTYRTRRYPDAKSKNIKYFVNNKRAIPFEKIFDAKVKTIEDKYYQKLQDIQWEEEQELNDLFTTHQEAQRKYFYNCYFSRQIDFRSMYHKQMQETRKIKKYYGDERYHLHHEVETKLNSLELSKKDAKTFLKFYNGLQGQNTLHISEQEFQKQLEIDDMLSTYSSFYGTA